MTASVATRQWLCKVCGWIYDEERGAPDHGLAPGTRLEDIPADWYCPECGVTKEDFEPLEF
jgi:rubredoxin-NAD+ reductase